MAAKASVHYTELLKQGRELEEAGEEEKAASLYEQAIRQRPLEEFPFDRLMVFYRKAKNYKEELRVIETALSLFKHYYDSKPEKLASKNAGLARISKQLLKALTGSGRKTPARYYPASIIRWEKRKSVVEKKLSA